MIRNISIIVQSLIKLTKTLEPFCWSSKSFGSHSASEWNPSSVSSANKMYMPNESFGNRSPPPPPCVVVVVLVVVEVSPVPEVVVVLTVVVVEPSEELVVDVDVEVVEVTVDVEIVDPSENQFLLHLINVLIRSDIKLSYVI